MRSRHSSAQSEGCNGANAGPRLRPLTGMQTCCQTSSKCPVLSDRLRPEQTLASDLASDRNGLVTPIRARDSGHLAAPWWGTDGQRWLLA